MFHFPPPLFIYTMPERSQNGGCGKARPKNAIESEALSILELATSKNFQVLQNLSVGRVSLMLASRNTGQGFPQERAGSSLPICPDGRVRCGRKSADLRPDRSPDQHARRSCARLESRTSGFRSSSSSSDEGGFCGDRVFRISWLNATMIRRFCLIEGRSSCETSHGRLS